MLIYGLEQALIVTHGYDIEFNAKKSTVQGLPLRSAGPYKKGKSRWHHFEELMERLAKFKFNYRR
ncbi:MAG: hypothetical protein ACI4NR_02800 [Megasphaera sp.]|uniref:hypothetical protein n=1 Tax=Megasphaera sp. TaxID=2023260 RepID=UPI003F082AF6